MNEKEIPGISDFPETRWTLVRRAVTEGDVTSFEALSELCESYWYPLYAFVRMQGAPPEEAADEVQGFFAALLEKDLFEAADKDKGRLRTFLLDALKKFRSNQYRAKQAEKRGGGRRHLSIDQEWAEGRLEAEPVDGMTPEQILDRSWARLILDEVTAILKNDYVEKKKLREFEMLYPFLAWNSGEGTYAEAARKLGISEGNLKVRVHRMRARYRKILEDKVQQTLDCGDGVPLEEELRHLLSAL